MSEQETPIEQVETPVEEIVTDDTVQPEEETPEPQHDPLNDDGGLSEEDMLEWAETKLRRAGYEVKPKEQPQQPPQEEDDDDFTDSEGYLDVKRFKQSLETKMYKEIEANLLNRLAPTLVGPATQSFLSEAESILGSVPGAMDEIKELFNSLPIEQRIRITQMPTEAKRSAFLEIHFKHTSGAKPTASKSSFGSVSAAPSTSTNLSPYVQEHLPRWQESFPHLTRNQIIEKLKANEAKA